MARASPIRRLSVWTDGHNYSLFVIIAAVAVMPFVARGIPPYWTWLITASLLVVFILVAGHGFTGTWRGALIDSRNKISLSRLQMLSWTVLVLSAYLAMALSNLARGAADPLLIAIPEQLWLLLGISTASLVGSGLILAGKKNQLTNTDELDRNAKILGVRSSDVQALGQVTANESPRDAGWANLFEGEETGNFATLDLAKIQMFFFTLVVFLSYAVALGSTFSGAGLVVNAFPPLSESTIALIGISHAGYLTSKAAPHTPRAT